MTYKPARWFSPRWISAAVAIVALSSAACSAKTSASGSLQVVTTTGIIADFAKEIGGDRVQVSPLVPPGGDPHSYEPTPGDAKKIAQADVTFTNHLLLEEQRLIKAIDANVRDKSFNVSLAETSETYGATVIPLVENIGLDVLWLGMRVNGDGKAHGATRTSDIRLSVTDVEGPGDLVAYLTEALGAPNIYFNSGDGISDADLATLPPAAHTHLNWAFTKPGHYKVSFKAGVATDGKPAVDVGEATFRYAVGVDPKIGAPRGAVILDSGHADVTIDLDADELYAQHSAKGKTEQTKIPSEKVVFDVPAKAISEVPSDPRFSALGQPGAQIYQLPQAVIGKHVHGEIDPHLWQDVNNAKAYAQLVRDHLKRRDPDGAKYYDERTAAYVGRLDELNTYVGQRLAEIPENSRQMITTHDAFGYLAKAYGLKVAGFVVPNPAQEPSAADIRRLTETIRGLDVRAVFLEPNLVPRASVLKQVATDQNVRICTLYGDSFDAKVTTYVDMMRHNADELLRCLGGRS